MMTKEERNLLCLVARTLAERLDDMSDNHADHSKRAHSLRAKAGVVQRSADAEERKKAK
jgi:hypothetical protein